MWEEESGLVQDARFHSEIKRIVPRDFFRRMIVREPEFGSTGALSYGECARAQGQFPQGHRDTSARKLARMHHSKVL